MKLVGLTEEITLEEAQQMFESSQTEFLYYMKSLIDELAEDEEENLNLTSVLAEKLHDLLTMYRLFVILDGPEKFLDSLRELTPEVHLED